MRNRILAFFFTLKHSRFIYRNELRRLQDGRPF
jgi:hypothetical protein